MGWLSSRVVSMLDSAQKGWVQITAATLPGNRLRQTVHTHRAAKLVAAALLRVVRVTAGLAESNGSILPGSWLTSSAGWLPRTGISSRTLCSAVVYRLPLPVNVYIHSCSLCIYLEICCYVVTEQLWVHQLWICRLQHLDIHRAQRPKKQRCITSSDQQKSQ